MSIESANQIINEQDLTIEDLRHKVLDMTDERDLAIGKALNLIEEVRGIADTTDDPWTQKRIEIAIADYNSK